MNTLRSVRPALGRADAVVLGLGAVLTIGSIYGTARGGLSTGLLPWIAVLAFTLVAWLFFSLPHVAVAAMIPLFVAIPTLKLFTTPYFGAVKDVVIFAAVAALVVKVITNPLTRKRVDRWVGLALAVLLFLYILNLGGLLTGAGDSAGWAQGLRLTSESLLLLLVGLTLDDPKRTLRWAVNSLVATGCVIALLGLLEQALGPDRLIALGFPDESFVRRIGSHLRSFGTLDDAFAYAVFLVFALMAVVLFLPLNLLSISIALLLCAGIAAGLVRSSAVIVAALLGLWLARHSHVSAAILLLGASIAAGLALLITTAGGTESKTVQAGPSVYLTLNGRTQVWSVALGTPWSWPLGKGVGVVGTAATRATQTLSGTKKDAAQAAKNSAVDSGYFSVIADVGFVGLAVLFALLGRLCALGARAARHGRPEGWLALGLITALLIDALTRESFVGFPTAHFAFLLIGLALAAAAVPGSADRSRSAEPLGSATQT